MRQLDQVCESPDSESIQCALDFENTMNNLETQLYYRHLPPKEVALRVMEAACKFYDADWCGLIQVDLDLGLWKPLWWHNECQEDKTTILTNEFESSDFKQYEKAIAVTDTYHETRTRFAWVGEIKDKRLQEGLEKLSDEELRLITLYFRDEYSTVELSKVYGIAQQNISKRILKITKFLKKFGFLGVD